MDECFVVVVDECAEDALGAQGFCLAYIVAGRKPCAPREELGGGEAVAFEGFDGAAEGAGGDDLEAAESWVVFGEGFGGDAEFCGGVLAEGVYFGLGVEEAGLGDAVGVEDYTNAKRDSYKQYSLHFNFLEFSLIQSLELDSKVSICHL